MASEEFTEGSEQKRPNVQMGDPFLEKLLLEACLEVMKTGAVLGIQDMGAAGLTCSTCEMGARGSLGVSIELDKVPQRETGMSSYEIMLSESQERMLLVAEKGREEEVLAVFRKWGLDCAEVGIVTADDVMRVFHGGVLQAEIPNKALTDDAPVYHRPVGVWNPPVPKDPPAWVLEELKKPRDYTADLKKLLASPNICSKHYIYEQYDSMVQTNTVQGPGGEAGVMRIKGKGRGQREEGRENHPILSALADFVAESTPEGEAVIAASAPHESHGLLHALADLVAESTPEGEAAMSSPSSLFPLPSSLPAPERGLAMALAGNGRWCYLDPKLGAMHAVAEAARKVACTGATPVAATNCLNFGNPEKPEIMAQLSAAIDGIAEACTALGTPVTGGNVSLYNETRGEGIYPTPVIGIVGIIDDVTKAVPSAFQSIGDYIVELFPLSESYVNDTRERFGSSEYAKVIFGESWGIPPRLDIGACGRVQRLLANLADERLIKSAVDEGSGGVAVTMAKCALPNNIGAQIAVVTEQPSPEEMLDLFHENPELVYVTCSTSNYDRIAGLAKEHGVGCMTIGLTVADKLRCDDIGYSDPPLVWTLDELRQAYALSLESQLAEEVLA
jgi:phosphoribosylformylglycinamidine (FGAM) synthase-like enzyme